MSHQAIIFLNSVSSICQTRQKCTPLSFQLSQIEYDGLQPNFVKLIMPHLLPFTTHMFKIILTLSTYIYIVGLDGMKGYFAIHKSVATYNVTDCQYTTVLF